MTPRSLSLAALLALTPLAWSWASIPSTAAAPTQEPAYAGEPLQLYAYGTDGRVRDELIGAGAMYEDLGGWLVGRAAPVLAQRFGVATLPLPALPAGHTLVAVRSHAHAADQPANPALEAGRLLWTAPDGSIMLRALSPLELKLSGQVAFRCHGAYRAVSLQKPMVRAQFRHQGIGLTANGEVSAMVAQVIRQNLEDDVNAMVSFGTRRHFEPGEVACENWLVARMNALGLSTSTFNYDSGADVVIGELTGTTQPDKIVVIGGHYDSINYSVSASGPAPGADDDASGVAAVLEIARILAQHEFDYTIRFCGWSGEEYGLLGSEAYAQSLANAGADVVGMVQLDMIAYRAPGDTLSVDFVLNDTTPSLNDFSKQAFQTYVPGLAVKEGNLSGGTSDHRSFFQAGFPATFPFEDVGQYSPYIHTSNDTVGVSANDYELAELITKGALATVAELARPVSLNLTHQKLEDTRNDLGPYYVGVLVDDPNAKGIASVVLHWRVDGGAWNQQAMIPTGRGSEYGGAIPGQPSPSSVEYYVVATDGNGVQRSEPSAFNPGDAVHSFLVGNIVRIYFNDFEGATDEGWTHAYGGGTSNNHDDWQRGTPAGKAGDPSGAWSGSKAWGNDIGGSGWNGEYQSDVNIRLVSPSIDCSAASGVRLRYRRALTVEEGQYDQARLRVAGQVVWENPASGNFVDNGWTLHDLDISALADGNPALSLRWELRSDGGVELGGWNIDDVEVYAIAPANGLDYLRLTGPATVVAGNPVSYAMSGAPAGAPWWILYSTSNAGTTISGHAFDVGPNYKIVGQGLTGPLGDVSFTANVPAAASGLTVYVEGASYDAGSTSVLESNLLPLAIQ